MGNDTEHLYVDSDGVLYLKVFTPLEDGDVDCELKRLGEIEDSFDDVPADFEYEYDELLDLWNDGLRGAEGYAAAVDLAWRTAKGA